MVDQLVINCLYSKLHQKDNNNNNMRFHIMSNKILNQPYNIH